MAKRFRIEDSIYRFSSSDYHRMMEVGILTENDRVELIDGQIIPMSPIKSPHAACVDFLTEWFVLNFHGKGIVRVQNPIALSEFSEPEPDLLLAKFKADRYQDAHPKSEEVLLLIEVSDTTLEKDQKVKIPLYAQAGIREAWIININDQNIERYTTPSPEGYNTIQIFRSGQTIETELISGLSGGRRLWE